MKSETANRLVEAVMHYQKTGNHKQVVIHYNPANRTEYEFKGWKHERDHHSPRAILPEDIVVSKGGHMLVVGYDNRYNLKQFASQHPQHIRAYRMDRIC
tara:strand:+ start:843 stop:1139 length:297 start_codon:yes stop_codon:yes gene_type:complete